MGTHPCKQRRARLTAGALLALQISLIASASHAAAADLPRSSTAATTSVRASVPVSAIRPAGARTAVTGTYDADVLATARSPYRQATAPRTETAPRAGTEAGTKTKTETKAGAEAGTTSRTEAAASSHPIRPIRIGHVQATQQLRKAGLRWKSSGGCTNRSVRTCTSLEAVRAATVADVIALKQRSGCPVVVTGGTEVGHAPGRYSHHRGYKLDIKPNDCINRYITREHVLDGIRGDGAPLYRDSGTVYARESDHWDILFR
ncbi:hypothetical protein [Streptosporangium roseum]|uniref:hypothetical protein n=1 Tax=Streptosporangium roseum TaxID=2001 RepID=UPI00068CCE54|nr:hypothetical protein [Streptosporangium roseum]